MRHGKLLRGGAPLAVSVAALLLVGCSTAIGGQAQLAPSDDRSVESDEQLPHSGAPKVPEPLDASKLRGAQQDPCSTLTSAQVSELGLDPRGKFENAEAGPLCDWDNLDAGSSAGVYFPTKVIYQGLSQIYESHKRFGGDEYFFAMKPVQGFPVLASATADERDTGICELQVGLTDEHVTYVHVRLSYAKQGRVEPCVKARDVAAMAVTTIQEGS